MSAADSTHPRVANGWSVSARFNAKLNDSLTAIADLQLAEIISWQGSVTEDRLGTSLGCDGR